MRIRQISGGSYVFGTLATMLGAVLITSFFYGFEATDEAYYLYNLLYPSSEVAFSPFAWQISPLGALFGHHIVGYRVLALLATWFSYAYLACAAARVYSNRLALRLPLPFALFAACAIGTIHVAWLPTYSYNTSQGFGVTIISAGFLRVLAGSERGKFGVPHWHILTVALGMTASILARTVMGVAIGVSVVLVALPTLRALGLLERWRDAGWYVAALLFGMLLVIPISFAVGDPAGLFATQNIMWQAGGGAPYIGRPS